MDTLSEKDIIVDATTLEEAGFDNNLHRGFGDVDAGEGEPVLKRGTDATNLSGGIIGEGAIVYLGSLQVRIDGTKQQILINDGVTDRVLIGKF